MQTEQQVSYRSCSHGGVGGEFLQISSLFAYHVPKGDPLQTSIFVQKMVCLQIRVLCQPII